MNKLVVPEQGKKQNDEGSMFFSAFACPRPIGLSIIAIVVALGIHTFACGSNKGDSNGGTSEVEECKNTFSVENGYGHENQWRDEGESEDFVDQTPEEAEEACESDGGDFCDAGGFITTEAAICIAEFHGLEAGIATWRVSLSYISKVETAVVWLVENLLEKGEWESEGRMFIIHATTGELLEELTWASIY